MEFRKLLIVLACLINTWSFVYSSTDCKGYLKEKWTDVRDKLLCKYDTSKRPPTEGNKPVDVKLEFYVEYIDMSEETNTLYVNTIYRMSWKDSRLAWKEEDPEGRDFILVNGGSIWVPGIGLVTMGETNEIIYTSSAFCVVFGSGTVDCAGWSSIHLTCLSDLTYWPYNYLNCEGLLAPWQQSDVNLLVGTKLLTLRDSHNKREWDLVSSEINKHSEKIGNSTLQYVDMAVSLKRFSAIYEASVVIPALVFCMVALASSFIEADKSARLYVLCTLVVCHVLYLQVLSWSLLNNANSCPRIVLFYRDSLAICGMSLMVVLTLRWIITNKSVPPKWIDDMVSKVEGNHLGHWIIHLDAPKTNIGTEGALENTKISEEQRWYTLGTLLDRFGFFVKTMMYFVLMVLYFIF